MFWKLYNEDMVFGDLTSETVIPQDMDAEAKVLTRERCVVAGADYVAQNLRKLGIDVEPAQDGEELAPGTVVMSLSGNARSILAVERTVLNILSRLSGIATETRRIVEQVKAVNPEVRVAATRKTLWGVLDKQAVVTGGGDPHRWNLGDMVMIKDNHIALVGLENAIKSARAVSFTKKIEVEVEDELSALLAAGMGVDVIMLDNMAPGDVCAVARKLKKYGVLIEVSGGITPENVLDYAKCEVDIISMGYLTHSSRTVNMSMELQPLRK